MPKTLTALSEAGKQELALALILWKDFKSDGKFDVEILKIALELAEMLGVMDQYNDLQAKIPPMRITPR